MIFLIYNEESKIFTAVYSRKKEGKNNQFLELRKKPLTRIKKLCIIQSS